MISVEEASLLINKHFPDFGFEETEINSVESGITAENIVADRDYPPFNRVMMDGVAVNFKAYEEGRRIFKIEGVGAAGESAKSLSHVSSCIEVMTGAPLPNGTDLVIPFEHVKIENGYSVVNNETERIFMDNVHLKGSDVSYREVILSSKRILHGPHWGIAASVGSTRVKIKRSPVINIVSTGDELIEVSKTPLDHQIRRSNVYALKASLKQYGFNKIELSHLSDNREDIESHYLNAKEKFDVLIYSGGVSKGKFDYLPSCWKKLGIKEVFHGVRQRPGKPMWFGVDDFSKTVVIGLPGNPVSSLICLHRYILQHSKIYAVLSGEIIPRKNLTSFIPVKIEFTREGVLLAHPLPMKNSGEFSALEGSDGFLELPEEPDFSPKRNAYLFHPWRPW